LDDYNSELRALRITMPQNLRGLRKSSKIPRAKRAKDAKFGIYFLSLAALARLARDLPNFACGSVALGPSW